MLTPQTPADRRIGRLLLAVTCAAAVLSFLGPVLSRDGDVWWHMRAGELIAELKRVPDADVFSYTAAGRPWVYHSWLSGLILAGLWRVGQAKALIFLPAVLLSGALALSWALARRRGVSAGLASVLALAVCLQLRLLALARPFLFSFVMFLVFALVLQGCTALPLPDSQYRRGLGARGLRWLGVEDSYLWGPGGRLLLLPLLMVLWANLHAGFVSGLLLPGAYGVGEIVALACLVGPRRLPAALLRELPGARFRAMVVAGVLCLAGAVVTPQGPAALVYPFWLVGDVKLLRRVKEWQPMPLEAEYAVFWAVAALGAVLIARSVVIRARDGRLRSQAGRVVADALLMGGFTLLAARAARNMAWVLLLAPAVLGWHLRPADSAAPASAGRQRLYAILALALALVIGPGRLAGGLPTLTLGRGGLPDRACDFMAATGLTGRLYNSYEWGGYLIWRFWPHMRVFIDGRCEVYRDDVMGQALQVEDGTPGWQDVLERWGVELLVVNYRKKDASHLFRDGRWRCVYWDDGAVIALRDDVKAGRYPGLREIQRTNPALLAEGWTAPPDEEVLEELEAVLARDPECWTAHAMRARVLASLSAERPTERAALLSRARASADRAIALQPYHYEPWLALREVATAQGDARAESRAAAKVRRLRPAQATKP
jgi:hypothetical protein